MHDTNAPIHDTYAEAARLQQALVEAMQRAAERLRHRRDPDYPVTAWQDLTEVEQHAWRAALDQLVTRHPRHLLRLIQLRGLS